jgi:hypothetical protein
VKEKEKEKEQEIKRKKLSSSSKNTIRFQLFSVSIFTNTGGRKDREYAKAEPCWGQRENNNEGEKGKVKASPEKLSSTMTDLLKDVMKLQSFPVSFMHSLSLSFSPFPLSFSHTHSHFCHFYSHSLSTLSSSFFPRNVHNCINE